MYPCVCVIVTHVTHLVTWKTAGKWKGCFSHRRSPVDRNPPARRAARKELLLRLFVTFCHPISHRGSNLYEWQSYLMPPKTTQRFKTLFQGRTSQASAVNWITKDIIGTNSIAVRSWCDVIVYCVLRETGLRSDREERRAAETDRALQNAQHQHLLCSAFWEGAEWREGRGEMSVRLRITDISLSFSLALCLSAQMANPTPEGEITMVTAPCHACLWMLQCRSTEEPCAPMATQTWTASCSFWICLPCPIALHSVRMYLAPRKGESTIDYSLNMPMVFRPIKSKEETFLMPNLRSLVVTEWLFEEV